MAFSSYPDSVMDRDIARSIKPAVVIDDHSYIRASAKRLVPKSTYLNADVYAEIKKIAQDSLIDLRGVRKWTQLLGYYSDSAIAKNIHYNDSSSLLLNSALERDQRIRLIIDSIYREVSPKPLAAPEQVAMLRASRGLPPLSYYLRLFTQKK